MSKYTLNIGLAINENYSRHTEALIRDTVTDCGHLAKQGLLIERFKVSDTFTGKAPEGCEGEPTIEVELEVLQGVYAFEAWLYSLAVVLQQDCIAYASEGGAALVGPSPWDGGFNADYFGRP